MGVDVQLYAEGDITDEQIEVATSYLLSRCAIADTYDGKWPLLSRRYDEWTNGPRVEMSTSQRYYGEGYERGDWPSIYGAIRLMQAAFPHCRICYGGDTDDTVLEVTEESLAETWAHFLGPHGDDYRQEARLWNAAKP